MSKGSQDNREEGHFSGCFFIDSFFNNETAAQGYARYNST